MLVAGEASGDIHGAPLVKALLERQPTLEIFGVTGERLRQTGMQTLLSVSELTGMGLVELAGNLRNLWRGYRLLRRALTERRPNLVILIDFPEFNLRLAKLAKRLGIPVLYYISPQIWAWRRYRVRAIARWVDRMAVVFPFESEFYEKAGVEVTFVGHPLLDMVSSGEGREATLARLGLEQSRPVVALLPGSRTREVTYHLPVMLEAAASLREEMAVQFFLVRAHTVDLTLLEEITKGRGFSIPIASGNGCDALRVCDLAWTASGTATLETALMLKPMIIVYRLSWLTYMVARWLVSVEHVGMVNIVAGERIVPELIQSDFTAENIVRESRRILRDPDRRQSIVNRLAEVRGRLGSPGAAGRVADLALSMLA